MRKGVSLYRIFSANKLRSYDKICEYYHFAPSSSFVLPYGGSQYTSVEILFLPNWKHPESDQASKSDHQLIGHTEDRKTN